MEDESEVQLGGEDPDCAGGPAWGEIDRGALPGCFSMQVMPSFPRKDSTHAMKEEFKPEPVSSFVMILIGILESIGSGGGSFFR